MTCEIFPTFGAYQWHLPGMLLSNLLEVLLFCFGLFFGPLELGLDGVRLFPNYRIALQTTGQRRQNYRRFFWNRDLLTGNYSNYGNYTIFEITFIGDVLRILATLDIVKHPSNFLYNLFWPFFCSCCS